ncbi:unnamed protein product [Darwinula stevensoni]|uniref:SHSP domain-containing protein n=1 Tax=Darwinula stevensoni TaxID=69355 RepID=A0A7R9A3B9_9CRUS|nr:unnamed protein product [Darwinula stevensoni]CAG0890390.1 unnamed protein product [Darwinula stevensoni]
MSHWSMMPFRDWWDDMDRSTRLFDQHFGMGLSEDELAPPTIYHPFYIRPRRPAFTRQRSGMSEVVNDKEKFQVSLDVQQFAPGEITVKTVDNVVVIEGKHEEKKDEHGFISRQFLRKYMLPQNVKAEDVASSLSSDGVLTITARKLAIEAGKPSERTVPISQSGKPAIDH